MAGIFKAYDIRGRYPDELSEATARNIGNAFVRLLGAERIVVGRDMRLSSRHLPVRSPKARLRPGRMSLTPER
ncbi:protein of unknown function [Methanoculleus bourgensis]|uniref:Alpha-D-phosphohexomutase alpha/beta/alpha domain-containing protein n=1 Tax=Methanoculleus bourgensis TaxID=83986 RepID=A0A0X8XZ30_9EURY|nr:protein of unknown function [Methanoculleus bourgensis]